MASSLAKGKRAQLTPQWASDLQNTMRPKRQPYPATKIKVGAVLYSAFASTDEAGKTSTEIDEWIVRSIQAKRGSKTRLGFPAPSYARDATKYVNITRKIEFLTWGRRSKKIGDFGWLKSIPPEFRKQFAVGEDLYPGIYTTPRAALLYEIASIQEDFDWHTAQIKTETDPIELAGLTHELSEFTAQLAALKRRLVRLTPKKEDHEG